MSDERRDSVSDPPSLSVEEETQLEEAGLDFLQYCARFGSIPEKGSPDWIRLGRAFLAFNSASRLQNELEIVNVNPEGDGSMALYIDDELQIAGDEYHNDIHTAIDSYIGGMKFMGASLEIEHWYMLAEVWGDDCYDLMCEGFPNDFNDLPLEKLSDTYA